MFDCFHKTLVPPMEKVVIVIWRPAVVVIELNVGLGQRIASVDLHHLLSLAWDFHSQFKWGLARLDTSNMCYKLMHQGIIFVIQRPLARLHQ